MKTIVPKHSDTKVNIVTKEWIPNSFESFLAELDHIVALCNQAGSLALFRGHGNREWLLDSTYVRSFKKAIFNLPAGVKLSKRVIESVEFHYVILNLYLLKYGVIVRPSEEFEIASAKDNLDAWFELMKRYQQYPKEDKYFLKGTNLIDWTQSSDVALFFANDNRDGEGAIYICDATATGKTLQVIPLGAILDEMNKIGNSGKPLGAPLLFCPTRQIKNQRARNQEAVYFAQMDLRYDLETMWRLREAELKNETILIKLVLPAGNNSDATAYLVKKGIHKDFLFPNE